MKKKTVEAAKNGRDASATTLLRFGVLPTFKLDVLGSITARHGELLYERLFGLRIVECRILGVVARMGPVTLRQTCIETGIDKGQGSRLVSRMQQAGFLDRRDDPQDLRSFYLLLTPAGRQMHDRVATAGAERNKEWLAGLPPGRRADFVECLELLTRHAQKMLAEESARSERAVPPPPLREQAEPLSERDKPLLVEQAALRDIHRRLGALLEGA